MDSKNVKRNTTFSNPSSFLSLSPSSPPLPIKLTRTFRTASLHIKRPHNCMLWLFSLFLSMCPPFVAANRQLFIKHQQGASEREGTRPEDLMVFDNVTLASVLIKEEFSSTMLLKRNIVFDLFSSPTPFVVENLRKIFFEFFFNDLINYFIC